MIPLYGFVRGDSLGLLILAYESETIAELADKVQNAARVRVAPRPSVVVLHDGRELDPADTIRGAGITALDRVDVLPGGEGVPEGSGTR